MSLLDTVKPDAKVVFFDAAASNIIDGIQKLLALPDGTPLYSHPKVESLLAENRKQVLMEVIAEWEKPFVIEPEKFIDRLRRMAEGEK